jgi:uncharacterized coiled-coil protein SlyX
MRILATMQSHQRLIFPAAAAFVFIVAGLSLVRGFGGIMAAAPSPSIAPAPTVEQVSNEILETAKGLGITQQQAVDQLQVVQDQLVAQKAETKKLSEQIAALTEKLNALQVAAAPTVTAPVSPPKR